MANEEDTTAKDATELDEETKRAEVFKRIFGGLISDLTNTCKQFMNDALLDMHKTASPVFPESGDLNVVFVPDRTPPYLNIKARLKVKIKGEEKIFEDAGKFNVLHADEADGVSEMMKRLLQEVSTAVARSLDAKESAEAIALTLKTVLKGG